MQNESRKPETSGEVSGLVDDFVSCAECVARGKTWKGSEPKCAFNSGRFSENWNCATAGLIRDICDEGQTLLPDGIDYAYCDDDKYATIKVDEIEIEGGPLALWVSWYKNRGSTQAMWFLFDGVPPRVPTETECLLVAKFYS